MVCVSRYIIEINKPEEDLPTNWQTLFRKIFVLIYLVVKQNYQQDVFDQTKLDWLKFHVGLFVPRINQHNNDQNNEN